MQNKLTFAWEPMPIEECMSVLWLMVDYELVLMIIEDGTEAQFSGSGWVHAFTSKQVNAGGT